MKAGAHSTSSRACCASAACTRFRIGRRSGTFFVPDTHELRISRARCEPIQQGHLERLFVRDAVFPQSVFAPAIAVIGARDNRSVREAIEQRFECAVAIFDTSNLASPSFARIVVAAEWLAGVVLGIPVGPFVKIRN